MGVAGNLADGFTDYFDCAAIEPVLSTIADRINRAMVEYSPQVIFHYLHS